MAKGERYAFRNLSKCTKDCICLFVCPTGATDTETGQIDFEKCIGCGACAVACPSRAITLLPWKYPKEQIHKKNILEITRALIASKVEQEKMLAGFAPQSEAGKKLRKAFATSCRVMAEDLMRESGYMIPQGAEALKFLKDLKEKMTGADRDEIDKLIKIFSA